MGRLRSRVITARDVRFQKSKKLFADVGPPDEGREAGASTRQDAALEAVIKYVPGEVVVAGLSIAALFDGPRRTGQLPLWIDWACYLVLVMAGFLWTISAAHDNEEDGHRPWFQSVVAALATAAWLAAIGPPFTRIWPWYSPVYGAATGLCVVVLAVPIGRLVEK